MDAAIRRHAEKVTQISAALAAHDPSQPLSLRKRSVAHQVPKAGDLRRRDAKIDLSRLTEILEIDVARRICVAEAGVTFVDLVAATLPLGLVPIVLPELKTITIGGAVSGCSIESTSFVHGGFADTCLEYEVLTATGERIVCTPENEHHLLFQMVHGAFGTLGVLTRLTFRLMPAQPFVHVVYEAHDTLGAYQAAITRHASGHGVDFMDGIIHSPTCYVLSLGRFVATAPYTSRYDWLRVYHESTRARREDYLATADYFFRYDRGVTNVRPRSFLGRLLLGRLMTSARWLWLGDKLHWLLRTDRPTVTLDVFVPFSKVPAFLAWHEREIGFYPLWCVPYRRVRDYAWLRPEYWAGVKDELFLDLAIYGMPQTGARNVHRLIEQKLAELGGVKTLISHNYYGEDEFWSIWNKPSYDAVKAITDPQNVFRDLYEKTCRAAMGLGRVSSQPEARGAEQDRLTAARTRNEAGEVRADRARSGRMSRHALIAGLLLFNLPSLLNAETRSRAAVQSFLAGKGVPKDVTLAPRAENGRPAFTVEHAWKNGNGLTISELNIRDRKGKPKLRSDWTRVATKDSLKVTVNTPKNGLFGYSIKKDVTTFTPVNNGWMATEVHTLRDGSEHAMLRSVIHGDRVTYTSDVYSSNDHQKKYGRRFSATGYVPAHLIPGGDVSKLSPREKIALSDYLSRQGSRVMHDWINQKSWAR